MAVLPEDDARPNDVDMLILGSGWTTSYLVPLLKSHHIMYATTSSSGHAGSIPFRFDPSNPTDTEPYKTLPNTKTLVITFPLRGSGEARGLLDGYRSIHQGSSFDPRLKVILLGSTGIWKAEHNDPEKDGWTDSDTGYDISNPRAQAEDAMLDAARLSGGAYSCHVLNLAGLYGGTRQPWNWISRVAKSKEDVRVKGSLHLIHGDDLARAILHTHTNCQGPDSRRWIITDMRVYDWWEVIFRYGAYARDKGRKEPQERNGDGEEEEPHYKEWVQELMVEEGIRALPRSPEKLGRRLDGRAFWQQTGNSPTRWLGDEWNGDGGI